MNIDNSAQSREDIVEQLETILAWLDKAGEAVAAIHVNQAIELLRPAEILPQLN